jgi:hypothetical protein
MDDELKQYLGKMESRLNESIGGRIEAIERQMRILATSAQTIDGRMPILTKASFDTSAAISSLYGIQMERGAAAFDLAGRVRKLEEAVEKLQTPPA